MNSTILDHILWVAPTLESGCREFESLTGVCPVFGGKHEDLGTHNALVSLGPACYLEVLALDPDRKKVAPIAKQLADYSAPSVFAFHLKQKNLVETARTCTQWGVQCSEPMQMTRQRPDGTTLTWQMLITESERYGRALPMFIDWGNSPHPAESSPSGCTLVNFEILHPYGGELISLYHELGIQIPVKQNTQAELRVTLNSPNGEVSLQGKL